MMTPQHSKRHSAVGVILSAGSPGRRIAVTLKQGAATWWRRALRTEVAASAVSGWNHPSHGSYGIGHPNRWCLFCNDFFRRSRDLMRAQIRGGGKGGGGGVGVSVCWYDFESQRILRRSQGGGKGGRRDLDSGGSRALMMDRVGKPWRKWRPQMTQRSCWNWPQVGGSRRNDDRERDRRWMNFWGDVRKLMTTKTSSPFWRSGFFWGTFFHEDTVFLLK